MRKPPRLDLPICHYNAERVPDDRPGAGSRAARQFWNVRSAVVEACRQHGPVGPDDSDRGADYGDYVYWVVDDQYNDERYQYLEFCQARGVTEAWLSTLVGTLRQFPQWGVGISSILQGYLLVFADRLMVTGPTYRGCTTAPQVIRRTRRAFSLDELIRSTRDGAGLEKLRQTPGVKRLPLALNLSEVTDAGLRSLVGLPRLQILNLEGSSVTDDGLKVLPSLCRLEELSLRQTAVTGAGLLPLTELPKLKGLDLAGRPIRNASLQHVGRMAKLETLDLSETRVTSAGLHHLGSLHRLRKLSLRSCRITDSGLLSLQPLNNLEGLDVSGTRVTDAALRHLMDMPKLTDLDLTNTGVTRQAVYRLRKARPSWRVSSSD